MHTKTELKRITLADHRTNPVEGKVIWSPLKSLWLTAHCLIALIGGALTFSIPPIIIFILTTSVTLCLGHSLGMHRRFIHKSYECPIWLEYLFVHLGVLVGLAGPFGMMQTHDLRDWAQRQSDCHSYLRHGSNPLKDAWWQLHCDLKLTRPPHFVAESSVANDKFYRFMERTWMLQQLPLAAILFYFGGYPWVVWGISARVAVSVIGHWFIGYFAHNLGEMDNEVLGASVQGHNVKWSSYITMGESWHNNHHAFPDSAILGIYENQPDPGWWILKALQKFGLVWNISFPENLPERKNRLPISNRAKLGTVVKA